MKDKIIELENKLNEQAEKHSMEIKQKQAELDKVTERMEDAIMLTNMHKVITGLAIEWPQEEFWHLFGPLTMKSFVRILDSDDPYHGMMIRNFMLSLYSKNAMEHLLKQNITVNDKSLSLAEYMYLHTSYADTICEMAGKTHNATNGNFYRGLHCNEDVIEKAFKYCHSTIINLIGIYNPRYQQMYKYCMDNASTLSLFKSQMENKNSCKAEGQRCRTKTRRSSRCRRPHHHTDSEDDEL